MSDTPRPRVSAGRRDNAATEGGARLTGPRREVLAALRDCGPADAEAVAERMRARRPTESALVGDALTESVSRILWKLQALGWVQPVDGGLGVTAEGEAALSDGSPG